MNEPPRTDGWKCVGLGIVFILLVFDVHADSKHECQGNACNGDIIAGDNILTGGDVIGGDITNTLTGGDVTNTLTGGNVSLSGGDMVGGSNSVSVAGSRSYGLSTALGDVDINQCVFSIQRSILFVGWQNIDYNSWCMGESYDAKGLLYMGALSRCDIKDIRSHFNTDDECVQANTITLKKSPDNFNLDAKIKENDDRFNELYALIAASDARAVKAEADASKARRQAQRAQETVQTTYKEPEPFLTAAKRAKLQAILDER